MIEVALDDRRNKPLRDPDAMLRYVKERMQDQENYDIILDEVQYMDEFEGVLTEFRGRGDEIHLSQKCQVCQRILARVPSCLPAILPLTRAVSMAYNQL